MSISIPVGVLLASSLLCLWFYVHRSQRRRRRRRPKSDLVKSASQRSRRPQHKHTISADTAASKEVPPFTGWGPYYKSPPLHAIPYPAPLRTRTSPSPTTGTSNISPRSKLPSNMVSTGTTLRATPSLRGMATLSPRPLSVNYRPPPPPRGLVSWEARGIQHARTKSMRESMRHSSESQGHTERVKVAMQVPRDANISEWKSETRTPTPNTEAGSGGEKR
ncbi:MAG: hypothetical protein LQ351_000204 [Letrouitia transgressa]|nr:MAG: hypothetical protein LQ351_000204 [Letrouitia transgressa]